MSRSRFAQHTLHPEVVAAELERVRAAIGGSQDVARFFTAVLHTANVPAHMNGRIEIRVSHETPRTLRQAIGREEPFAGRFDLPLAEGEIHLGRTSPVVEGLASWTLDQALDPEALDAGGSVAARCGAIVTTEVSVRTTLLVVRFRYHLRRGGSGDGTMLCEEIVPLACSGPVEGPVWLSAPDSERLLAAQPARNLLPTAIEQQLGLLLPALPVLQAGLEAIAAERADAQRTAHERVRAASGIGRSRARSGTAVEPVLPADILGAYVLLPVLN